MGLTSGQPEQLADGDAVGPAGDRDLGLAVDHHHDCLEGRGVLAEALAGVEGERRDGSRLLLDECATDDRTRLVVEKRGQGNDPLELVMVPPP